MTNFHRLLHSLGNRLDGLLVYYLLGGLLVTHEHAEQSKEYPQQGKAEEYDAHSHQCHAKAVRVFTLELFNLRLADVGGILDAGCHAVGTLYFPVGGDAVVGYAGIRLTGLENGYGHRVDELGGITVIEGYPSRLFGIDP